MFMFIFWGDYRFILTDLKKDKLLLVALSQHCTSLKYLFSPKMLFVIPSFTMREFGLAQQPERAF